MFWFLQATQNEITQAYRRLSKVFHPDKHIDEQDKKRAQRIFNRVKRAYEGENYNLILLLYCFYMFVFSSVR